MADTVYRHDIAYQDSDGVTHMYPRIGQGPAVIANDEDIQRDNLGFTHPNLHRRVDPQPPEVADNELNQELLPRDYKFSIMHVHSYRTTHLNTHDEESIDSEIP